MSPNPFEIGLQIDEEFEHLIDDATLVMVAEQTLRHQGLVAGQLSLVLTTDDAVHELNRVYRHVDGPTDVLSFPNREPDEFPMHTPAGDMPVEPDSANASDRLELILPEELEEEEADYLGDIIIAVPYTTRQAERLNRPLQDEMALLVVHGVLHLLGYDHATEADEAEMWSIQRQILGSRSVTPPVE